MENFPESIPVSRSIRLAYFTLFTVDFETLTGNRNKKDVDSTRMIDYVESKPINFKVGSPKNNTSLFGL